MEKILVVYGDGNTGKTTVVNDIYDELLAKGASVVLSRKKIGGDTKDFTGVLNYNTKTVAFLSMGDFRTVVDGYVAKFKKYDIFVTALNKQFGCISTVWLKNSNEIIKIEKTIPTDVENKSVRKLVINKI